jgi:uncharacterized cupredoxin-like copper-binding protein
LAPLPVAAVLAAALLAGCMASPPPPDVYVQAVGMAFEAPATMPAGWVKLHFENRAPMLHHVALLRLDEGKTAAEALAVLERDELADWMHWAGGVGPFEPNAEGWAVLKLQPGRHLLLCLIPGEHGVPHMADGMVREVMVQGSPDTAYALPSADIAFDMHEFGYSAPVTTAAGTHTFKILSQGGQPHEAVLAKLDTGATVASLLESLGPNATAAPPARFVGLLPPMGPGGTAYVEATLTAGRYVMLCFLNDPASGAPHFARGMLLPITVA